MLYIAFLTVTEIGDLALAAVCALWVPFFYNIVQESWSECGFTGQFVTVSVTTREQLPDFISTFKKILQPNCQHVLTFNSSNTVAGSVALRFKLRHLKLPSVLDASLSMSILLFTCIVSFQNKTVFTGNFQFRCTLFKNVYIN